MAILWVRGWLEYGRFMSLDRLIEGTSLFAAALVVLMAFLVVVCLISRILRIPTLRRTSYAVTSNRALAIDRKKPSKLQAVFLDTVDPFDVTERADQTGSIVFGYSTQRGYKGREERVPKLLFDEIDNVAFVCALAKDAAGKHRRGKRDD
jgi:hypothetical protein